MDDLDTQPIIKTMIPTLTLPAPAKLNLFLHIVGRRSDGYHQLQTLFQILDWSDTLTFESKARGGLSFSCSDKTLESEDNLVLRAARAIETECHKSLPVHIHLDKRLPMGGGIGGGSSDCATTLLGLNALFDLQLPTIRLLSLAESLGADVPIFVAGHSAWAEGIGEQLTPIGLPEQWFVIIHPDVHISTATLFSHPELTRNTPVSTIDPGLALVGHNDFEPLVRRLYPEIEHAFAACRPFGEARLTGTGACLFLAMPDQKSAEDVQNKLTDSLQDAAVYVARGQQQSPVIPAIARQIN